MIEELKKNGDVLQINKEVWIKGGLYGFGRFSEFANTQRFHFFLKYIEISHDGFCFHTQNGIFHIEAEDISWEESYRKEDRVLIYCLKSPATIWSDGELFDVEMVKQAVEKYEDRVDSNSKYLDSLQVEFTDNMILNDFYDEILEDAFYEELVEYDQDNAGKLYEKHRESLKERYKELKTLSENLKMENVFQIVSEL